MNVMKVELGGVIDDLSLKLVLSQFEKALCSNYTYIKFTSSGVMATRTSTLEVKIYALVFYFAASFDEWDA